MSDNLRSQVVTQGVQRSPNRAMLRAVGFKDEDFKKAIVGIANGYSTITPCNMGINQLAQRAEIGIKNAGAMPQIFGTITIRKMLGRCRKYSAQLLLVMAFRWVLKG